MFQRKNIMLAIFCLLSVISLVGCSKSSSYSRLPKQEQNLVWSGERTKPFGEYDYFDISQKEAIKLVKDKFKLELPVSHDKISDFTKKDLILEEIKYTKEVSFVFARDNQLKYRTNYVYNEGDKTAAFVSVDFDYTYLSKEKEAILSTQTIQYQFFEVGKKLSQSEIDGLLKEVGSFMKVTDMDKELAEYHKELTDSKDKLANKTFVVSDNAKTKIKDKELTKKIVLLYDESGNPKELYARIGDAVE
ncbi:hypothetical protein [Enterococcus rotai]|uniref:hypothetical protein n=1 Tax=Enterococcus rotai TaxID=118060 RepID=UPI0032B61259